MNLQLYYAPITCALVPYITLTEAGAGFDVHALDFGRGQHMSPEYLAINPKHKVPLLLINGKALTENVAIHLWVSRTFPDARILPRESVDEIKAISIMSWCSGGIHPFLSRINSPPRVCALPEAADGIRQKAAEMIHENFAIAEQMLAGREWFFDHFTAPDAHFFWCFRRAGQFDLDLSPFPQCQAHFDRMRERDSVRKLEAFEAATMARFAEEAAA